MARFAAMIDMAKDIEEIKEDVAEQAPQADPSKIAVPAYPYGLCLALTEDEMEKLGLGEQLPEVGEMIHLAAMAKVTSVSENEREMSDGSKKRCARVELQITHLATELEDDESADEMANARRKRFYDDKAA